MALAKPAYNATSKNRRREPNHTGVGHIARVTAKAYNITISTTTARCGWSNSVKTTIVTTPRHVKIIVAVRSIAFARRSSGCVRPCSEPASDVFIAFTVSALPRHTYCATSSDRVGTVHAT